jgi:hypothetical protein
MVTHQEVGEGSHNRDEESDERRAIGTPPGLAETVRSLMVELQSCKADNERMMKEQEKQTEINAILLQSLSTYSDKCSMNLRCRIMVVSVATLREAHPEISTPEVKDQYQMIPLRRKLVIQKALPVVGPVPILERNRRSKRLPRVINLRNSKRPNLPPSMAR